ncbi:MAG: rRNA pseudouridine synthase [Lachnospiraceae bacterium]|nr:rRNA pseudouridine synthase [Lachnospiraceae bacterium]
MRINKFMARCGVCSRREADGLIKNGVVTINGRTAVIGDEVEDSDEVSVSGKKISLPDETIVIAYYKPVGVVCSGKDSHADRIISDEIPEEITGGKRVTYAGRLDKDSEGLIILTDDGDLIDAMMKGSNMHEKEYEVRVNNILKESDIKNMRNGIYLEELDTVTRPCRVRQTGDKSFNIILTQGLNRQIRRMCESLGLKVQSLKRTRVMNLTLENLQVGASRKLTSEEKKTLYSECGLHI